MSSNGILKGGITCAPVADEPRYRCLIRFCPYGRDEPAGVGVRIGPRHVLSAAHCFANSWALDAIDVASGERRRVVAVHFEDLPTYVCGIGPPLTEAYLTTPADRLAIAELDADMDGVTAEVNALAVNYRGFAELAAGARRDQRLVPVATRCIVVDYQNQMAIVREDENPCVTYGFSRGSGTPLIVPVASAPLSVTGVLSQLWRSEENGPISAGYIAVTRERLAWIHGVLDSASKSDNRFAALQASRANSFTIKDRTTGDDHFPYPVYEWDDPLPNKKVEFYEIVGFGLLFFLRGAVVLEPIVGNPKTMKASFYGPPVVPNKLGPLIAAGVVKITAHPGNPNGRHWLQGTVSIDGDDVYVYLFCMDDDPHDPDYKRQLYMEAFKRNGSYDAERPEYGTLVPPLTAAPGAQGFVAVHGRTQVKRDYAQDDIGTGHERKPT